MRRSLLTVTAALAVVAALALSAAPAFAQTAPVCVQGKTGVPPTATLSFTAPTTNTDGSPVATPLTYEIFEGSSPSSLAPVAKGVTGSPVTVNTGLTAGSTVYFTVAVVDANGTMSAPSNVVCKTFPAGVPASVSITIT